MHHSSDTIRQAALVLAKLDRKARDTVLDEMPTEQAEQIRSVLLNMDSEDPVEQDAAILEFLASRMPSSLGEEASPGTSSCDVQRIEFERIEAAPQTPPQRSTNDDDLTSSLHDLLQNPDHLLGEVLSLERATTVAALLSSIPGVRAARILKSLPADLRTRVLMILDARVDPHPKAIEVISEWICDHLAAQNREPSLGLRHRTAVQAILDEFSSDEREAMLDDIAQQNPLLAQRLSVAKALKRDSPLDNPADCYC